MQPEQKTGQDGASAVATLDDREGSETTAALSKDIIFKILASNRRQSVLFWLDEWDGQGTTGKLAEHIAAEENDITVRELMSDQRKRVYVALHQCHLPKMADYGVIAFDQSRGTMELTDAADDLFPYLELREEYSADSTGDNGLRSIAAATLSWLMTRR